MSCATIRPSRVEPRAMPDDGRVTLGRRREVLVAVVDHPDGTPGATRQQRRVEGDHRRVLLLAAEPAARLLLDDPDARVVEAEALDQRAVHVVRALEAPVDRDPAVLPGQGDHRVVLDVQLLLVADPVGALDHDVGGGQGGLDVPAGELVAGEHDVRGERIEHRRERLGAQPDPAACLAQGVPVGRRQQGDRLRVVTDLGADRDQDRLVRRDARHDVAPGDVVRGDDGDAVPGEGGVEVDAQQACAGVGRPDRGAVPGAREDEVVGVGRRPGELGRALASRGHTTGAAGTCGAALRHDDRALRRGGVAGTARPSRGCLDRQREGPFVELRKAWDPTPRGVKGARAPVRQDVLSWWFHEAGGSAVRRRPARGSLSP